MVPFAIKTDMFEAMKRADVSAGDVDTFLDSLLAEHDYPGVSIMLRNAWTKYIRIVFRVRIREEAERPRNGIARVNVRCKATTPPPSPPGKSAGPVAPGAVGGDQVGDGGHGN